MRGPLFYLIVFINATRSFPEFSGSFGRVFPGQDPPRKPEILPREVKLPRNFKVDILEIELAKKHRHKIKDSGMILTEMHETNQEERFVPNEYFDSKVRRSQSFLDSPMMNKPDFGLLDPSRGNGLPEVYC